MSSSDEVRLAVPAMPEYLRLARVTAAGLASRLGFSFDEVEDLRLAIDELCYGLTGTHGRPGTVEISYRAGDGGLVIEGDGRFDGAAPAGAPLSELSQVILAALVDEHDLSAGEGGPHFRLVKRRRAAGAPPGDDDGGR
ncbi:MAG TPA: ATP-binding protein [Acidimicrobiales bacterium]|nr:ATP-binding protein [Acidimicrobiales bacterium]